VACRGIHEDYAVLDCSYCNGKGNLWILKDNFPPRKETCKMCKGTCLIRIPLKNVPVLDDTLEIK
jgi:hypothetical protein